MTNKAQPRFLVDFMLGRLARWLRILGYDAEYITEKGRPELILRSLRGRRILLTRDHRLSRNRAWKLVLIKSDHLTEQIKQLIEEPGIAVVKENLFTRCTICNSATQPIAKEKIKSLVPEYVYQAQAVFSICPVCKRIYWPGTHWELLLKGLAKAGIRLDEHR